MTHGNRGNQTTRRGRGYRARLSKEEQDALGGLAQRHGYDAVVDDGITLRPAVVLTLAIISGEVATVLLDTDERWRAVGLLEAHEDEALRSIGAQLRWAAEREEGARDA